MDQLGSHMNQKDNIILCSKGKPLDNPNINIRFPFKSNSINKFGSRKESIRDNIKISLHEFSKNINKKALTNKNNVCEKENFEMKTKILKKKLKHNSKKNENDETLIQLKNIHLNKKSSLNPKFLFRSLKEIITNERNNFEKTLSKTKINNKLKESIGNNKYSRIQEKLTNTEHIQKLKNDHHLSSPFNTPNLNLNLNTKQNNYIYRNLNRKFSYSENCNLKDQKYIKFIENISQTHSKLIS